MRKIITFVFSLSLSIATIAQKDVTKFLGFPVDGSKSEMIRNLRTKGFKLSNIGGKETLTGRFNGQDVRIFICTEKGKVYRIMVGDLNTVNETDIKIRFNNLCNQFKNNGKYLSLEDYIIPESEDIYYEMMLHNKRYEAVFYQLPEGDTAENLQRSIREKVLSKYTEEQLENATDEIKTEIFTECANELLDAINNKSVWFMISEHYGKFYISMYYDNELNSAQGEDL